MVNTSNSQWKIVNTIHHDNCSVIGEKLIEMTFFFKDNFFLKDNREDLIERTIKNTHTNLKYSILIIYKYILRCAKSFLLFKILFLFSIKKYTRL